MIYMYSLFRRSQFIMCSLVMSLYICLHLGRQLVKLHRFTLFSVRKKDTVDSCKNTHKCTHVISCVCVGRLTSCSISFTLNRCDLTRVAQGYQAVIRIHLPCLGLAWSGLVYPGLV